MNKLEVGMYCYNKTNRKMGIGKIISFESNNNVNVRYKNDIELVSIGNLEASYNIINILEVGDYVNSKKVGYIDDCEGAMIEYYYDYEDVSVDVGHWFEEIQTIVTKEQMEQMSYRIGD